MPDRQRQITIISVSKQKVELDKLGSPAIIFVGCYLVDRLSSGRLIDGRGWPVTGRAVQIKVEPVSETKAKDTIMLLSKVKAGTYRLQLLAAKGRRNQAIDLPISSVKIAVG